MTNKATKYGLMTIAAVLLVAMAFAGVASAGTYSGGTGTADNPYCISNADDLYEFANNINKGIDNEAYFKQTADIALSDISNVQSDPNKHSVTISNGSISCTLTCIDSPSKSIVKIGDYVPSFINASWTESTMIGSVASKSVDPETCTTIFKGTYNGGCHNISGLFLNVTSGVSVGLFGCIGGNTNISNLSLSNSVIITNINSYQNSGTALLSGLVLKNSTITIDNVSVDESYVMVLRNNYVGGLIGNIISAQDKEPIVTISGSNVRNTAIISYGISIGGVMGEISNLNGGKITANNCTIIDSYVEGGGGVGGFAGQINEHSIKKCMVINCTIKSSSNNVGGILGVAWSGSSLDDCSVERCLISSTHVGVGGTFVGGLIGDVVLGNVDCSKCHVKTSNLCGFGTSSSEGMGVGGLIGGTYLGFTSQINISECDVSDIELYSGQDNIGGVLGFVNPDSGCIIENCNVSGIIAEATSNTSAILGCLGGTAELKGKNTIEGAITLMGKGDADVNNIFGGVYPGASSSGVNTVDDSKSVVTIWYLYYVTFDNSSVGASGTMMMQKIPYGNPTALKPNEFSRNGYDFTYWTTSPDGLGTRYDNEEIVLDLVARDIAEITLYANWSVVEYNITYNNMTGATNPVVNPATYNITSSDITLANAYKMGYTFEGWYNSTAFGDASRNNTIPTGSTEDKVFYANWTVNTTDVTASGNKAVFGNDNVTAIHSTTGTVVKVLLEDVSNVTDTAVNFTADNTSIHIPSPINGYNKEEISIFDFNATAVGTAKINVTVTFVNETSATAEKDNVEFYHYNVSKWEPLNSTIVRVNNANVTYTVETNSFSPFGIGLSSPITYTVHFDANGGVGSMDDMAFTYDVGRNLTANAFQRYNSNFLYWTYDGTKYYNTEFVQNLTVNQSDIVVMKAEWETYSTGGSSSGTSYLGSNSASYTPTEQPTVKPTVAPTAAPTEQPATPTVIATAKPTTQATQASPAPFVGLLAGLGAAAVLLSNRRK